MVEKGTRNNKASRALLSSQVNTQVYCQADEAHGYNSHVEPRATVRLRLSQEASPRSRFNCVQLYSIAFIALFSAVHPYTGGGGRHVPKMYPKIFNVCILCIPKTNVWSGVYPKKRSV